ncbi:phage holin family protein, partial [Escherichia coli]|nr:phage holin family protein [Escherichia coli]
WLLMTVYALPPLAFLCGTIIPGNWLVVFFNLLFCVLVIRARGNVSKILVLRRR